MAVNILKLSSTGKSACPTPECMGIKQFRALIDRDESGEVAWRELAYIYHMVDPSSPYAAYSTDEEREENIIRGIMPEGWKVDVPVWEGVKAYRELNIGPVSHLLSSSISALHKVRLFLDGIDFKEVDDNDKPLYGVRDVKLIMDMLANVGKTVEGLDKLKQQVDVEKGVASRNMKGVQTDPQFSE